MKIQFSHAIAMLLLVLSLSSVFAQSTEIRPGLILPQMTTAKRTGLLNPVNGSLVFDTNTLTYWYRQPGIWIEIKGGADKWILSGLAGNELTNSNTGGFWSKNPTALTLASNNITNPPTMPINEAGTRLMWIPSRSAFRVGTITNSTYWVAGNIGLFSFAAGINNQASGKVSTSMGYFTRAFGDYSMALGSNTDAYGLNSFALGAETQTGVGASYSVAIGYRAKAEGVYSVALGTDVLATGTQSMAIGYTSTASGDLSYTLGNFSTASAKLSMAIGNNTIANGAYSTAMGNMVHTSGLKGSFIIGDTDPANEGTTGVSATDQFVARFNNGYALLTSGNMNQTGVQIGHGETSWSAISDSTRKEKFVAANGESFLLKLRNLRLGSWNYKKQGANPKRFYGPMAQEIYAAFGKDKYGTIGNDTTVSTINMDGLLFIFSQALEKRTQDLLTENQQLKESIEKSEMRLQNENKSLKAMIQKLDARLEALEVNMSHQNRVEVNR